MYEQKLKPFGTRLDEDLIIELKVRAALRRIPLQHIIDEAARLWLEPAGPRD